MMPPSPSREEAHLGDVRIPRSVLKPHLPLILMLKEAPTGLGSLIGRRVKWWR